MSLLSGINVVTDKSKAKLNQREFEDYRAERTECLRWLLTFGKTPDRAEGYAEATVRTRGNRMDYFYRFVWEQEGHYTSNVTHEHANDYMKYLAYGDYGDVHKENCQKALKMLFKWRRHERGLPEWEPQIKFNYNDRVSNPRDYLTIAERKKVRETALQYGSIPGYKDLSPEARDQWKAHLAQRFDKPKAEVSPDDWDRANGWKIPSLVWTSLDTGLRPIEVERAVTGWVDIDNKVLRIPKEDSSKNHDNWIVGLLPRTVRALELWLEERENYDRYHNTDTLWLTKHGNTYGSSALRYLLKKTIPEGAHPH